VRLKHVRHDQKSAVRFLGVCLSQGILLDLAMRSSGIHVYDMFGRSSLSELFQILQESRLGS
jgi:hypothetical protein